MAGKGDGDVGVVRVSEGSTISGGGGEAEAAEATAALAGGRRKEGGGEELGRGGFVEMAVEEGHEGRRSGRLGRSGRVGVGEDGAEVNSPMVKVPSSAEARAAVLAGHGKRAGARNVAMREGLLRKIGLGKVTLVEGLAQGLEMPVVWASDVLADGYAETFPCVGTETVTVEPGRRVEVAAEDEVARKEGGEVMTGVRPVGRKSDFVFRGDQFDVRVVGMSVAMFDLPLIGGKYNELLLYSMETGPGEGGGEVAGDGKGKGQRNPPVIHYDFKKDCKTKVGHYQPIPDSRSLVTQCCGRSGRKTVNVNFTILEIDEISDSARSTIAGVDELAKSLTQAASIMPYIAVLNPALDLAGRLGQSALDAYAKPDRVVSVDMNFKLLPRGMASLQRSGDYLRYGYYFFLSKPVEQRLYASTTNSRHVRLMMRAKNKEFVPLKHVSYVVVKVGVPYDDLTRNKPGLSAGHARRLQAVCENVDRLAPEAVKEQVAAIMHELNGLELDGLPATPATPRTPSASADGGVGATGTLNIPTATGGRSRARGLPSWQV